MMSKIGKIRFLPLHSIVLEGLENIKQPINRLRRIITLGRGVASVCEKSAPLGQERIKKACLEGEISECPVRSTGGWLQRIVEGCSSES